jgi:exodeoxyribonuclease VII large subunit
MMGQREIQGKPMDELFDDETPTDTPGNTPEFTVTEISGAVKRTIEGNFSHVKVRGELGRVTIPRSGHVYLDLKDDKSVLNAVIWKGKAAQLPMRPEEGMEVVATGRLTTFGSQSRYQMVIEDMRPAGAGALMAMLEKRKAAYAAEGLFDAAHKKPLPYLPEVIGVVTSPTGAVIRDILHRLRDRFPRKVLVWPVAVQGERCAAEVARAVAGFNAMTPGGAYPRPDVLIVARGGGSVEDLWGFNEDPVIRAVAASVIPVISAIGHETDTTLIDYVSDRRAPTPTAAAELAVPVRLELMGDLRGLHTRMTQASLMGLARRGERLRDLGRALPRPERLTDMAVQRLDGAVMRLPSALRAVVQRGHVRLARVSGGVRLGVLAQGLGAERRNLVRLSERLAPALSQDLRHRRRALDHVARGLRGQAVLSQASDGRRRLERLEERMKTTWESQIAAYHQKLVGLERVRETLGYQATLARGFAVIRAGEQVVTTRKEAQNHAALEVEFKDGRLAMGTTAPVKEAKPRSVKPKPDPSGQGSLF